MRVCLECGKEINNAHDHREDCAYVRLEKLVNKISEEREKRKNRTQML